jgi:hypothetical protein
MNTLETGVNLSFVGVEFGNWNEVDANKTFKFVLCFIIQREIVRYVQTTKISIGNTYAYNRAP